MALGCLSCAGTTKAGSAVNNDPSTLYTSCSAPSIASTAALVTTTTAIFPTTISCASGYATKGTPSGPSACIACNSKVV